MKKVYVISESVYHSSVTLFIGSYNESEAYLFKKYKLAKSKQRWFGGSNTCISDADGLCVTNYIWMPEFSWKIQHYGTLAHECLHSAYRVLNHCGIPITKDRHETLAYLQGCYYESMLIELLKDRRHYE